MRRDAALYLRISKDRNLTALGVERQEQDCRALAAQLGWHVADVYIDNDTSATRSRIRPQYQRMLADVEIGRVNAVIASDQDRLIRKPSELEAFIALAGRLDVSLATVSGEVDLRIPQGRLQARIKGTVAAHETEQLSARIRREQLARAQSGQPHGQIAYGYRRIRDFDPQGRPLGSRDVIDEAQAAVIREGTRRVLAGESLRSVARALNDAGHFSPTGKPWGSTTLRQILVRERNAGLRRHQGTVIGEAAWEPIVDRATWEALRAVLSSPDRKTSPGSSVKHLLSGIASCGLCGGPMTTTKSQHALPCYTCRDCTRIRRVMHKVDPFVISAIIGQLSSLKPGELLSTSAAADFEVLIVEKNALEARQSMTDEAFARGEIDLGQLSRITANLRAQLEKVDAGIRLYAPTHDVSDLVGQDAGTRWAQLTVERRRAVIKTLVLSITILPAVTRGRTAKGNAAFDPREIEIVWR